MPRPSEFALSVLFRSRAAKVATGFVCLVCISFVRYLLSSGPSMGQTITTPLSLTLDHWQDVWNPANNLSVNVKKRKWQTFCTSEWPTFNVGWPQDGSFNPDIILQVKSRVFNPGPHRHPDQIPYIITWESLAVNPPPWVAPFTSLKRPLKSSPDDYERPVRPTTPSAPVLPSSVPLKPTPANSTP